MPDLVLALRKYVLSLRSFYNIRLYLPCKLKYVRDRYMSMLARISAPIWGTLVSRHLGCMVVCTDISRLYVTCKLRLPNPGTKFTSVQAFLGSSFTTILLFVITHASTSNGFTSEHDVRTSWFPPPPNECLIGACRTVCLPHKHEEFENNFYVYHWGFKRNADDTTCSHL